MTTRLDQIEDLWAHYKTTKDPAAELARFNERKLDHMRDAAEHSRFCDGLPEAIDRAKEIREERRKAAEAAAAAELAVMSGQSSTARVSEVGALRMYVESLEARLLAIESALGMTPAPQLPESTEDAP